jgi:hypothetical protein
MQVMREGEQMNRTNESKDRQALRATIVRSKIYPTPGTNYRAAWNWIYDVQGLGVELRGFGLLSSAKNAAKRHGATTIVEQWKDRS